MVRKQHKFLCLVLCLALIVTAVSVGAVSAFAASGDKVYVQANNGWSNLHCYMWNGSGNNGEWPGVLMTDEGNGVYSYTLSGDYDNIIFNNGSGGNENQTGDMAYPGANQIYDLKSGQWSAYSGGGDTPIPTGAQPTTPVPTVPSGDYVVYFKNTANWSSVNCYMWNTASDSNSAWPGVKMTDVGDGVWMYTASKKFANCIFNNGSDQTSDLTAGYGQIYDYGNNSWAPYDLSDLRVASFSADPESEIYTNSEVTLSAKASNKNGATVYYKFSVTNAAGSQSVVSDYSTASTVSWTPNNAGKYTVTFDFKDDAGNENSRSMELTVLSDAGVTSPIIQKVTPANLNLVKKNANTTVSVQAGGGKTGTNLLFYKYIVTDPNGVQNTPYYTLNKTYTFTPTKLGNYQVEVFVQASDNSTISKTYTYTVTDSDIPEPTTVQPTTQYVQPTTQYVQPTTQYVEPVTQGTTASDGYELGDADMDHFVNIKDATYVQKYCAEFPEARTIRLDLADVDRDGKITVTDATAIQILISR